MYQMITRNPDGKITDIQEAKKDYFWKKDGLMTSRVSKWVFNWTIKGYSITFIIK